jgi:hypothetical protein
VGVIVAPREMHARAIRIAGHSEGDKRAGLGGSAAGGRQWVSWVHEFDFVRAVRWLIGECREFCG